MCKNIVVYTAVTNSFDTLKEPNPGWSEDADFVAFLDSPCDPQGWQIRPAYSMFKDPCRNAKVHKILPHVFFPEYEYSIWIDGSITIHSRANVKSFIQSALSLTDFAVFKHRTRTCLYSEAEACMALRKDSNDVIQAQIDRYRSESFLSNAGLPECCVLVRRHTESIRRFNERWHQEILHHSRRDQISFPFVANRTGLKFSWLDGTIARNKHFRRLRHDGMGAHNAALQPAIADSLCA